MKANSAPILLAAAFLALPGCSRPTASPADANRASSAPPAGPGVEFLRNRTHLRATRTLWSGHVRKSRFHGALPEGPQVIIDQSSWLRFWRVLHDDRPVPRIDFGEDFVCIDSHDSNVAYPPAPNLVVDGLSGMLHVDQVYALIYCSPAPPAKTLKITITLYSRQGIRKFPAECLQLGNP